MSLLSTIQAFDVIVAVVAVIFLAMGVKRGLIGEAVRLVAVAGGIGAAVMLYKSGYAWLGFLPIAPSVKIVVSFIVIFVAAVLLIILVGWLLQKVIRLTVLDWVDRIGGGLFGLLKVAVMVWVFVRSAESSPFNSQKEALRKSPTYSLVATVPPKVLIPYFDASGRSVKRLLSDDPLPKVVKQVEQIKQAVDSIKTTTKGAPASKKK